jgi:hypothetical protein
VRAASAGFVGELIAVLVWAVPLSGAFTRVLVESGSGGFVSAAKQGAGETVA